MSGATCCGAIYFLANLVLVTAVCSLTVFTLGLTLDVTYHFVLMISNGHALVLKPYNNSAWECLKNVNVQSNCFIASFVRH